MNDWKKVMLNELRQECRIRLIDIARKNKYSINTVYFHFKLLSKYVKRYTCILDFSMIGFPVRSFILCKEIKDVSILKNNKNVNTLQKLNDGVFLIETVCSSITEQDALRLLISEHAEILSENAVVSDVFREHALV